MLGLNGSQLDRLKRAEGPLDWLELQVPNQQSQDHLYLQVREPLAKTLPGPEAKRTHGARRGVVDLPTLLVHPQPPLRYELLYVLVRPGLATALLWEGLGAEVQRDGKGGRQEALAEVGHHDGGALGDAVAQHHRVDQGLAGRGLQRAPVPQRLVDDRVEVRHAGARDLLDRGVAALLAGRRVALSQFGSQAVLDLSVGREKLEGPARRCGARLVACCVVPTDLERGFIVFFSRVSPAL